MRALLLLAALVALGIGPALPPGEVAEPGPLELRGRWEGQWLREGEAADGAVYQDGRLTLPMTPAWGAALVLVDEGNGRCRVRLGGAELLGIYARQDERLVLCWRGADRGRPTRFVDDEQQDVLILRRVRPGR